MDKELLTTQYILSRKYYLEGELKRCRKTVEEFKELGDMHYGMMIGKLEGEIDAYTNELNALRELEKKLEEGDEE